MSMFTSLYPMVHGVHLFEIENKRVVHRLDPKIKTLAEYLKESGYFTAAFTAGGQVSREFGFNRGFGENYFVGGWENGIEWIREYADEQFFFFFHTYAVHDPYQPPEPYYSMFNPGYKGKIKPVSAGVWKEERTKYWKNVDKNDPVDVEQLVALYDGAIRYADEHLVKTLLDVLTELELMDNTVVVLTSDHGEEFGEHGRFTHLQVYDESLHVPLLLFLPQGALNGSQSKQRIESQVRLIDVMPTLLELLGIPYEYQTIQGISLIPLIIGDEQENRVLYATKVLRSSGPPARPRRQTIRDGQYKLIYDSFKGREKWELYDVINDEGERDNIFDRNSENRDRMIGILERYIEANETFKNRVGYTSEKLSLEDATVEQLKALGYLQ